MATTTATPTLEQQRKDFRERLKNLQSQVNLNGSKLSSKGVVVKAPSKKKIPLLFDLVKEAKALVSLLPDVDDGVVDPEVRALAFARKMAGMPCQPPSDMKRTAYGCLKLAQASLGEALEAANRHEEALPVYHANVTLAKKMMTETWEDESQWVANVNSLALCYKRIGNADRAIWHYQQALDKADPGSELEEHIRYNIKCVSGAVTAGPGHCVKSSSDQKYNQSVKGVKKCCWNCGKNVKSNPGLKLMDCTKCKELKLAMPGCYCSRDCQLQDYSVHKKFHKRIAANQARFQDFQRLDQTSVDALKKLDLNGGAVDEYHRLVNEGLQCETSGDKEKAMKLFRKAIKLKPKEPHAHYSLAVICASNLHYQAAIDEYTLAMKLAEDRIKQGRGTEYDEFHWSQAGPVIYRMLTSNYVCASSPKPDWMETPEKILDVAHRAASMRPTFNETWGMMGDAYMQLGKAKKAAAAYKQAAKNSETEGNRSRFEGLAQSAEAQITA